MGDSSDSFIVSKIENHGNDGDIVEYIKNGCEYFREKLK